MMTTLRRRVRELARAVARVAASTSTSAETLSSPTRAGWGTTTTTTVGRASTWTRATMAWTRAYAQTHETARPRVNDEVRGRR